MGDPSEGVPDPKCQNAATFLVNLAGRGIQGQHPKTRRNLATELNPNLPQTINQRVSCLLADLEWLLLDTFRNPLDLNLRSPNRKIHSRPQKTRLHLARIPQEQHRSLFTLDPIHLLEVQSIGKTTARVPSNVGQLDELDRQDKSIGQVYGHNKWRQPA